MRYASDDPDMILFLRRQIEADREAIKDAYFPGIPRESTFATMQGTTVLMRHSRAVAELDAKEQMIDYAMALEDKCIESNLWNIDTIEPFRILLIPYTDRTGFKEEWTR